MKYLYPPLVMPQCAMFLELSTYCVATTKHSPAQRATVTAVGESPPRGFHSWLRSRGLTAVNSSGPAVPSAQNITTMLAKKTPVVPSAPSNSVGKVKDKSTADKVWIQVDSTKDKDDKPVTADKKTVKVSDAGIEVNDLVALSPYFESKIKPVNGYVSLAVFNSMWLKQDLICYSLRSKTMKKGDEDKYTGLPIPDKWKLSFGEWVTAFNLFVAYLRHYKHNDLANKFLIHCENVLAIKRERVSWIMAFCYNQAIQTTVMTFRNSDGKLANPAVRDESREREAQNETERLGEMIPCYAEINPYSDGQPKAHINPITGEINNYHNQSTYTGGNTNGIQPLTTVNQMPGPGLTQTNTHLRSNGRNVRGRGRGGGWFSQGNGGCDNRDNDRGRDNDYYDNCQAEGSGSWRRDKRRDDCKGDPSGPKYGGNGKAK
ncbi:uncharacterized protein MELLADRAFT_84462 [Melampsora larici-populina 98AG31]|uniref:Uncharacterized protein n=1 Tax=Melampsora larici-populina (strain 98AG31 / pathotype 3-4-7) TaxID=747676 RepID=F4RFU4_MELLP|nr:uncharacterized protein MELLADRAFT_84462 [Melampsora larici-populina 98AG31]EGG08867.1 hypothetical protein MELLADRAFT_84462 [Melampsora larici-populina 98AG31]